MKIGRKIEIIEGYYKSKHPIYKRWVSMRRRCLSKTNHDYKHYGGRGIKVCKRWSIFKHFLQDMGLPPTKKHSLDRIDNNGDYKPSNCRWATHLQQVRNARPYFHCKNGHPWKPETTRPIKKSNGRRGRICKICAKKYDRTRYLMKKSDGLYDRRSSDTTR